MRVKQANSGLQIAQYRFGHAIVTRIRNRELGFGRQRLLRVHPEPNAALDALHGAKPTVVRDVGCLRRPRRNRAQTRHDEERILMPLARRCVGAVCQQRFKLQAFLPRQLTVRSGEMPILGVNRRDQVRFKRGNEFVLTKLGKRSRAANRKKRNGHGRR